MARLTKEQWELAKADYEIAGLTQKEICSKYGLGKATVSEKVKKESWESKKTELGKERKVKAIIAIAKTELETELLTRTEQAVFDSSVADEVTFRIQSDANMQTVADKALAMLDGIDRPSDAKAIMDTLRIQREARLGKSPDVAVQVNNNMPTKVERVIVDPKSE